jgi:hypothetical protein
MRLREQLALIEAGLPTLRSFQLTNRAPNLQVATGKRQFLEALQTLSRVPALAPVLKPVISSPVFSLPGDEMVFDPNTAPGFSSAVHNVGALATMLAQALTTALPPVDDSMIAFRVPQTESLKTVEKTIDDLEQCLQQAVVQPKVDGLVRFAGVESGSAWLIISLGTTAAAAVIKVIAYASATIAQERVRHAQAAAYVRTLGFTAEMMEAAKDKAKVAMDKLVAEKAGELNATHYDGSPEQQNRLLHVLTTLSELFFQGAAIEPAKLPPANVDSGFPDVTKLLEAAGHPKLLPADPTGSKGAG